MTFNFNKYIVYAIIAAIAIAILTTYVLMWKASIHQQALLEFNNKQLEQIIKDQQTFLKQMNEVNEKQKQILQDLTKKNDELNSKLTDIENYLNSEESTKDNRESSNILKETFRQLGKR